MEIQTDELILSNHNDWLMAANQKYFYPKNTLWRLQLPLYSYSSQMYL